MKDPRLQALFLSELFPNPAQPALGVFVERQAHHLLPYCDVTVVVPTRVFPHLRLWKYILTPHRQLMEWRAWRASLTRIPPQDTVNGIPVFYPRYTSPPRQGFHGLWGFFAYPFLQGLLKRLQRQHQFDLVHAHYASPCGVIALLAQRWLGIPIVLTIHGLDVTYTAKQNPIGAAVVRWVFRKVDAILTNSAWTSRRVIRYGGEPGKLHVVHLGGNPPREFSGLPVRKRKGTFTLLTVGYLEERKGHAYVLRAVKDLRDLGYELRYVIVGDGSKRKALEAMAEALGISEIVTFAGRQNHTDVWSFFAACDIFVLPSWDEAFGVVYVEALALGKPVIGCQGEGGPEELSARGDCIELVRPKDVESLVLSLRHLLENPERRQRMGEIGREVVRDNFTWEKNAADTIAIYLDVLEISRD